MHWAVGGEQVNLCSEGSDETGNRTEVADRTATCTLIREFERLTVVHNVLKTKHDDDEVSLCAQWTFMSAGWP